MSVSILCPWTLWRDCRHGAPPQAGGLALFLGWFGSMEHKQLAGHVRKLYELEAVLAVPDRRSDVQWAGIWVLEARCAMISGSSWPHVKVHTGIHVLIAQSASAWTTSVPLRGQSVSMFHSAATISARDASGGRVW